MSIRSRSWRSAPLYRLSQSGRPALVSGDLRSTMGRPLSFHLKPSIFGRTGHFMQTIFTSTDLWEWPEKVLLLLSILLFFVFLFFISFYYCLCFSFLRFSTFNSLCLIFIVFYFIFLVNVICPVSLIPAITLSLLIESNLSPLPPSPSFPLLARKD